MKLRMFANFVVLLLGVWGIVPAGVLAQDTPTPTAAPRQEVTTSQDSAADNRDTRGAILIAKFASENSTDEALDRWLFNQLTAAGIAVIWTDEPIANPDAANRISHIFEGILVIYGAAMADGTRISLEIIPPVEFDSTPYGTFIYDFAFPDYFIPKDGDATYLQQFIQGLVQYYSEDADKAQPLLESAINATLAIPITEMQLHPIWLYLGSAYANQDNCPAAVAALDTSLALSPASKLTYQLRGICYYYEADYANAIADYTAALEIDPEDDLLYNDRGNAYSDAGEYEKAVRDYSQAIALDPRVDIYYFNRALTYSDMGDLDKAIADYSQSLVLNPTDFIALAYRAELYDDIGEPDLAKVDYAMVIAEPSDSPDASYFRGLAYMRFEQFPEAIKEFTAAIAANHWNKSTYYYRGLAYFYSENYPQAISELNIYLNHVPDDIEAYYFRALAYTFITFLRPALGDYSTIIRLDPTYANAYLGRGSIYYSLEDYEKALADFLEYERLTGQVPPENYKENTLAALATDTP